MLLQEIATKDYQRLLKLIKDNAQKVINTTDWVSPIDYEEWENDRIADQEAIPKIKSQLLDAEYCAARICIGHEMESSNTTYTLNGIVGDLDIDLEKHTVKFEGDEVNDEITVSFGTIAELTKLLNDILAIKQKISVRGIKIPRSNSKMYADEKSSTKEDFKFFFFIRHVNM